MTTKMIFIWIYIVGEFEELMETGQKEIKKKKKKDFQIPFFFIRITFLFLTLLAPCTLEICIKIKMNLNFYFRTSFLRLKRFYESTTKKCENEKFFSFRLGS